MYVGKRERKEVHYAHTRTHHVRFCSSVLRDRHNRGFGSWSPHPLHTLRAWRSRWNHDAGSMRCTCCSYASASRLSSPASATGRLCAAGARDRRSAPGLSTSALRTTGWLERNHRCRWALLKSSSKTKGPAHARARVFSFYMRRSVPNFSTITPSSSSFESTMFAVVTEYESCAMSSSREHGSASAS